MRIGPILCFVLAAFSTVAVIGHAIGVENQPVAYYVGLAVLPVVFLVGGLASLRKPKE